MEYIENICNEVEKRQRQYHAMAPEIVMTSSFFFEDFEDFAYGCSNEFDSYVYTRGTNPTVGLLEEKLAVLEHGERCKVFASGMGAISAAIITLLKAQDHVLLVNTVYGATVSLVRYFEKYGVSCEVVNTTDVDEIIKRVQEHTRMIYFESPSSQKFEMIDLQKLAAFAKAKEIVTVIDNTWASPLYQHPLDHGIDVVIHSCSKYVGGHSDIVCGAIISRKEIISQIEEKGYLYLGATCSPMNAFLALRGLRTLPVRMRNVHETIQKVIDALREDKRIEKIHHPYCGDAKHKALADKYLTGYGSLFAIDLADDDLEKLKTFVNTLQVFTLGVSWGGFESLALPVYKGKNQEDIVKRGLKLTHVRMYAGLEHPDTLIQDIKQALDVAYGTV
ncbi:aminotransferase class I/II-fold pyridoxal phosphate-dependent enzyme [Erysipelotrichaceae bacterium AM07-12]|uniref:trans-sulfuration enzyme family protein n=1 Tax=Longicatena caecimuris TaxID=1796635 RepID=UPI000E3FCD21|nr:aminotransferase class I/II-fold pyridoxal phosphate-dependent enzyme [Longicatena caecimuris]RGD42565.1 aminotransferase class I/II-fold pyridoxal phosphate-dependent enzyme [Erysipelotrichaceae bacterium AM07-12]RGD45098.1 aminotransferase class I/II-fold pyridoxal phosphate-dependent enzyme [Erysipelotrichaceae bacterium AM07-35-1]